MRSSKTLRARSACGTAIAALCVAPSPVPVYAQDSAAPLSGTLAAKPRQAYSVEAAATIDGCVVVGVSIAGDSAAAMIRARGSEPQTRRVGQQACGWTVIQIGLNAVLFERDGERRSLAVGPGSEGTNINGAGAQIGAQAAAPAPIASQAQSSPGIPGSGQAQNPAPSPPKAGPDSGPAPSAQRLTKVLVQPTENSVVSAVNLAPASSARPVPPSAPAANSPPVAAPAPIMASAQAATAEPSQAPTSPPASSSPPAPSAPLVQSFAAVQGPPAAEPPSENLAINLVQLLVKQGVISRTAGDQLLKQAEEETRQARALAAAAQTPAPPPVSPPPVLALGGLPMPRSPTVVADNASAAGPSAAGALPPPAPGAYRVPYVPQVVRDQIRDQVRDEVMQEAKAEGWAAPGSVPDWVSRIKLSGDVRFRSEYDLYSKSNATGLIDYATLNSAGPTDINPNTNPNGLPYLNTTLSRYNNLYLRARLGFDATVSDNVGASVRLATGNTNGPQSTSALLSTDFGKKNIWLDRAYFWLKPDSNAQLNFGRMPDPFLTTDLLYSDDLNFDGIDAKLTHPMPKRDMGLSLVGGAFPLGAQGANFPADASDKIPQRQSWLYAAQLGLEWNPIRFDWKVAAALYDFDNVRGQLSTPCSTYLGVRQCSTDFTTPPNLGQGNSLFLIRDIAPNPAVASYAQPQLVGLRFAYRLADLTTSFDYRLDVSHHLVFTGQYLRNTAYNATDACRQAPLGLPINNLIPSTAGNTDPCDTPAAGDSKARFQSGPNAWMVRLLYGDLDPTRFGEWNITAGYRYIEPDALLDGYNSADFRLGGTNAQGYTLTATAGLFSNAYLQLRWFSANEVFGPPLAVDVLQLDLHVRF